MTTSPTSPQNSFGNRLFKTLLPLAVILLVVVGGLWIVKAKLGGKTAATSGAESETQDLNVGSVLPDFELQQFGTKKTLPVSKLGTKVTLINFWATWCEACMVEMPSLVKLRKAYKDKGFDLVEIDVDEKPESVLPKVLKELGVDFPVYLDPDAKLAELFDVHAIPLSLIIDKDRKVLMIETGERDWNGEDIHSKLEQWLSG
jgi:thiol-disulfide isomerase/thioredoxin